MNDLNTCAYCNKEPANKIYEGKFCSWSCSCNDFLDNRDKARELKHKRGSYNTNINTLIVGTNVLSDTISKAFQHMIILLKGKRWKNCN